MNSPRKLKADLHIHTQEDVIGEFLKSAHNKPGGVLLKQQ
jgi:hypothetical protein